MNILITGGAGFIGSFTAERELAAGNKVVALDIAPSDKNEKALNNKNFTYVQGDVRDLGLMERLIKEADLVYHFAAIADPHVYCDNPLKVLDVDAKGTIQVIELCYKHGKKIVFSSTSEVYGKNPKVPWKEESECVIDTADKSRWCYSVSKHLAEHYLFAYKRQGLKMAIVRFFNFYGPRLDQLNDRGRVIACFLKRFFENKPVEVVEPGDQTRCFTYIDDGIDGILLAAHKKEAEGEAFNIGDVAEISMKDLAYLMKKIGGFTSPIVMVPPQTRYGKGYEDIYRRVPENSKIKKVLGWQPKVSLEEGLKRTIDYFRNQA